MRKKGFYLKHVRSRIAIKKKMKKKHFMLFVIFKSRITCNKVTKKTHTNKKPDG